MQLAAVGAIDVGEYRNRVLRLRRREDHHLRFRYGIDQLLAQHPPMCLGQVVVAGYVVKIARKDVLAIAAHVDDIGAAPYLEHSGHRSRADILFLDPRNSGSGRLGVGDRGSIDGWDRLGRQVPGRSYTQASAAVMASRVRAVAVRTRLMGANIARGAGTSRTRSRDQPRG